jgi:ribosomal protein S6--L-glutamate ligase
LEQFKSFITEEEVKPYKLVVFNNSNEEVRDVGKKTRPDFKLFIDVAKKVGIQLFNVEHTGLFVSEKNGKIFLNSLDFDEDGNVVMPTESGEAKYQKPIEIDPENTLIFARGLGTFGYTTNRRWVDIIKNLEDKGFKTIPSVKTWNLCASKYYCDQLFNLNNLRTPKTIPITYSDDSERAVKEGGLKFPLILKASSGSQTGVGVVIAESMRSLHPTVQMLSFLKPYVDLLVQEYIKIEYDIRVLVANGKVIAAMRRNVISGDVRSNASLGATTESIELTDIETETSIKVAELVEGDIVGVDLLPAKDREKEQPYILEVNGTPGLGGIEKITKGKSVIQEIFKTYMNRDNWKKYE